jgi:hypothetical protein
MAVLDTTTCMIKDQSSLKEATKTLKLLGLVKHVLQNVAVHMAGQTTIRG